MSWFRQFLVGNVMKSGNPQDGLFQKADGTVWLRNPDGSETQVDGGGGSSAVLSDTDPGAIGAGNLWVNTTPISGTTDRPVLVRNETNDGWITVGLAHYDGTGQLRAIVTMSDGAVVAEKTDADGNLIGFWIIRDDVIYISSQGLPIWLSPTLGGLTWGISAPSGAETFAGIPEPDDSELGQTHTLAQKLIWLDPDTAESRFKFTTDGGSTVTPGKIAGLQPDGSAFLNVAPQDLSSALTVADVVAALVALGLATS